jgi:hypothetical protein
MVTGARRGKLAALLLVLPFAGFACAQVLSLSDYGTAPPPEGTTGDGGPDVPCAERSEDCTNGVDDNCDGLVDCEDPRCSAFTCTPEALSGWQGPVALYEGAAAPPECGAGYPKIAIEAHAGLTSVPPAQCECACGTATGVACTPATVTIHGVAACTNACPAGAAAVPANGCAAVVGCNAARVVISGSTATGGSCAPKGKTTLPPVSWATQTRVCAAPSVGRGCAPSQVCAARPQLPFAPTFCVAALGDVACPGGVYTTKHLYSRGVADTRACAPCACGAIAGADCESAARVDLFNGDACTGTVTPLAVPTACTATGVAGIRSARFVVNPGGSCEPSGGAATGSAVPDGPVTVCCTQ